MSDAMLLVREIGDDAPAGEGASAERRRLTLSGDLTIYTVNELKESLLVHLCATRRLELDLESVGEVDTAGLQVLLLCRREAEQARKEVTLVRTPQRLQSLIDLYGLGPYLAGSRP